MISAVILCLFLSGLLGGGFLQCLEQSDSKSYCKPKDLLTGKSEFFFKFLTVAESITVSDSLPDGTRVTHPSFVVGAFLETTCKNDVSVNVASCAYNPQGKLAICKCYDVESCKYPGDTYEIDKNGLFQISDYRAEVGGEYETLYPNPNVSQFIGRSLETNIKREILPNGFKDSFRIKAEEFKVLPEESDRKKKFQKLQETLCDIVRTTIIDLNIPDQAPNRTKSVSCPGFQPTKL